MNESAAADDVHLTAEDDEAVRAAVAAAGGRRANGSEWTLNSLVDAWAALVGEVESGYGWCEPEFANDIWCRNVLGRVWPLLPARVRAIRDAELGGLDARFRAATVAWPDQHRGSEPWWRLRIPRRLEVDAGEGRTNGWPWGWEMLPFPKPDGVEIVD